MCMWTGFGAFAYKTVACLLLAGQVSGHNRRFAGASSDQRAMDRSTIHRCRFVLKSKHHNIFLGRSANRETADCLCLPGKERPHNNLQDTHLMKQVTLVKPGERGRAPLEDSL